MILKILKHPKFILANAMMVIIVLSVGASYGLWGSSFTQSGSVTTSSNCFSITYTQTNGTNISLSTQYPIPDEEGMLLSPYTVRITNTCSTISSYSVIATKTSNSIADDKIKIAVNTDASLFSKYQLVSGSSTQRYLYQGVLGPSESKDINIRSWIDYTATTSDVANKNFQFKISINAEPTSKLLSKAILKNNIGKTTAITTNELQYGEPTTSGVSSYNYTVTSNSSASSLTSSTTSKKIVGNGYSYNSSNGNFTLQGIDQVSGVAGYIPNNSGVQGVTATSTYTFTPSSTGTLSFDWYVSSESCCDYLTVTLNSTTLVNQQKGDTSGSVSTSISSGTSYTLTFSYRKDGSVDGGLDQGVISNLKIGNITNPDLTTSGTYGFVKSNTIFQPKTYSSSDVGKYTCNNNSKTCTTLYKINEVSGTTVTSSTSYSRSGTGISSGAGLYAYADPDGTSYILRGKIDNNYVKINGSSLLWRVVRINGDGSIRLILSGNTGTSSAYNSTITGHDYVGYTRNNTKNCNPSSPCIINYNSSTNTFEQDFANISTDNSTIKTALETWYKNNLSAYDDKIVLGGFCNDTSTSSTGDTNTYQGQRVSNKAPSLGCPTTSQTFGGYYKSKIGLITADELEIGGLGVGYNAATNNYIYGSTFWTMTPRTSSASTIAMYYGAQQVNSTTGSSSYAVRPVINLKPDIQIKSGRGTSSDPYIVR